MERYFKKRPRFSEALTEDGNMQPNLEKPIRDRNAQPNLEALNPFFFNLDLDNLHSDLGLLPIIIEYHPNIKNAVRRVYLLKPLCQPC